MLLLQAAAILPIDWLPLTLLPFDIPLLLPYVARNLDFGVTIAVDTTLADVVGAAVDVIATVKSFCWISDSVDDRIGAIRIGRWLPLFVSGLPLPLPGDGV